MNTTCVRLTAQELGAIRSTVEALRNLGWADVRDGEVRFTRDGLEYMQQIIRTVPLASTGEKVERQAIIGKLFGSAEQS